MYNLLLVLLSLLVSPYLVWKMVTVRKHRAGFRQRLGFYPPPKGGRRPGDRSVWIHAVSIGELLATIPLYRLLRETHRDLPVTVSTVTGTAMAVARQRLEDAREIIYLPFDYPLPIRGALRCVKPRLLVHTESEIWPNLLFMLGRRGIPSAIVNGRISARSCRRYGRFRFFYRWLLRNVSVFGMQSRQDCLRMIRIGADPRRIHPTGNMKFDIRGPEDSDSIRGRIRRDLRLRPGAGVLLAGSTHAGEEEVLLDALARLRSAGTAPKMLLAPRHPERCGEVERLSRERGLSTVRRTLSRGCQGFVEQEVLILDTIGELFRAYSIADVVFLGGTLAPIGGHNILEPLWYRKPVLVGPHTEKIEEVVRDLRAVGGVVVVRDAPETADAAGSLLRDPDRRHEIGEAAHGVLRRYQGATERNLALLEPFLSDPDPAGPAGPPRERRGRARS